MSDSSTSVDKKKSNEAYNMSDKEKTEDASKDSFQSVKSKSGSEDDKSTEKASLTSESESSVDLTDEKPGKSTEGDVLADEIVDEHKELLRSQEILLESIRSQENALSKHDEIRPCDSCEFPDPYVEAKSTCCWGLCTLKFSKKTIREYWIVSVPGGGSFDRLNDATRGRNLSVNYKFHIPHFKTGTINQLMELTDQLKKLDSQTEGVIRKLADFMNAILEESEDPNEYFAVNNVDIPTYITRFTWNSAKYSEKKSLPALFSVFKDLIVTLEHQLKKRAKDYNELDSSLEKIERQQTGSLLTRTLTGIVKKEDFILDSDFLTTILVVVPHMHKKEWFKSYESLAAMVVPQSGRRLYEDQNHLLFSVVLYKKSVEEFRKNAREIKCIVRDYEYSEQDQEEEMDIQMKLQNLKKVQIAVLYRWIKVNFSDSFSAWIHVKAMRVFVESVLRYGLPVNYQAMLVIPLKSHNKLREILDDLFKNIDCSLSSGYIEDIPGTLRNFDVSEYFPYVFFTIKIDIFSDSKTI